MGLRCFGYPALLAFAFCLLISSVYAQDPCQEPVGKLASIEGEVDIQDRGGSRRAAQLDYRCVKATPYVWETAVALLSS
jgi:hypothetical protein